MKLSRLFEAFPDYDSKGDMELEVTGIAYDSRKIQPGDLFVAIRGNSLDGHDYCMDAIRRGAVAIVTEEIPEQYEDATIIRVPDSRKALSQLAARFYDYPYDKMSIIGITGTNGKTTTSYILESIFNASGASPGVIGTINSRFKGRVRSSSVTTPESLDLMRLLREMADEDITHAVLEVSSHALDQGRIGGLPFSVAIFTNFTRDHLDYHKNMEDYFKAKSLLFKLLGKNSPGERSVAVINMDDPKGQDLMSMISTDAITYGLSQKCDVRAESISSDLDGVRARLITHSGDIDIESTLIGNINIYNIMAATAAALSFDIGLKEIAMGIRSLKKVPGRLELVKNARDLNVIVDYAHTPDALSKTLDTVVPLVKGRLITVFGCGGDRDQGKRPEMGFVAGKKSDIVFITSDNPRSEVPVTIIAQIEPGVEKSGLSRKEWEKRQEQIGSGYFVEADRREAIRKAISIANRSDLILIAGKGHEDYQLIGKEKRFFNDREEVLAAAK